jgi:hypothetical protein
LIDVNVNGVVRRGEGMGLANMQWATAALYNGLGTAGGPAPAGAVVHFGVARADRGGSPERKDGERG